MKDKFLIQLIGKIRDCANQLLQSELKKHNLDGISPSHGEILGVISLCGKVRMTDLATSINRDKSTVTALVNKLVTLGYVKKEADINDNRITIIKLSKKGEQVKGKISAISKKLGSVAYKGITTEEKEILYLLLNKVFRNF